MTDFVSIGFALVVAVGGILGYVRKGSTMSLGAGLVFGGLMGVGAYQTSVNPNNYMLSLATSGVLTAVMGSRFINSGKFMPAGLVAGLSLLMVARFGYRAISN
ncbi:transmembrane protein 14C-like isoform X2 [Branchiostoma lanceolatum]|uniref:transmembrane protein 14C-like isoform X2 n=1 Tax=Branchiostoma lanceolatum TaxID=7740 RepID=UPI0034518473